MNTYLIAGTSIVFFALLFYSLGIFREQHGRKVSNYVLFFLSLGLICDITATAFMIVGSSSGGLSLHGFIGYSSLLGMMVDNFLLWRIRLKNGPDSVVPGSIHLYSRYAYAWWVIAFITGALLVYFN